jgi:molecular chaperone DnaK (HSP70)
MSTSLHIGFDFGSLSYRAAYLLGDEIVTVPAPIEDYEWQGMILAQPEADAQPFGLTFVSLKYYLGTGRPVVLGNSSQPTEDLVRDSLAKLRAKVSTFASEDAERVVLAVPARYSAFRRAALRQTAQAAGFRQVDMINDCTAAALGHTFGRQQPGTLLVFSMGFHGFECSLLRYARQQLRELAHDGAEAPGGRDIDLQIMAAAVSTLERRGIKVPIRVWTSQHWFELRALAASVKERLTVSGDDQAEMELPSYLTNAEPARFTVPRDTLDRLAGPAVENSMRIVERILGEANLTAADIDEVVLVGGSSRLSAVQTYLEALFGAKLVQPRDDQIARGAAVQAQRLESQSHRTDGGSRSEAEAPVYRPPEPAREPGIVLPLRPDLGPMFAYAEYLIQTGQMEVARSYLDEIQAKALALTAHLAHA